MFDNPFHTQCKPESNPVYMWKICTVYNLVSCMYKIFRNDYPRDDNNVLGNEIRWLIIRFKLWKIQTPLHKTYQTLTMIVNPMGSLSWPLCPFHQGLSVKTMIELQNDPRLKKLMRPANWNMRPSTIPPPVARNFNSLWSYFTFPRTILRFSSNIQQWCTSWVLTTCMIAQSNFNCCMNFESTSSF
jgi:hypothetical protein